MSRILGLDLGTNSIGWAIIDDKKNKNVNYDVNFFNITSDKKITSSLKQIVKKEDNAILNLNLIIYASLVFCIMNLENWQFWLNVIVTTVIAKITLLNQVKK